MAHPNVLAAVGTGTPETTGSPRFLVVPIVLLLRSVTPVGPNTVVMAGVGCGPRLLVNEGTNVRFSFEAIPLGFGTRYQRFAAGITPRPRMARFRLVTSLYRAGLATRRIQKEVSAIAYITSSPSRLGLAQRERERERKRERERERDRARDRFVGEKGRVQSAMRRREGQLIEIMAAARPNCVKRDRPPENELDRKRGVRAQVRF